MNNFERDVANTMLDAADARIASLEADKADLLRVLGIADEKIRSGEDARGQYIRENAAIEARLAEAETARMLELVSSHSEYIKALEARCRESEAALDQCRGLLRQQVEDVGPLREQVARSRETLDRINMMACYASEENTDSREAVLLEIGKLARSAKETIEKPKPIAGEVGCEDENGMLTIHLESETCEVCAPELCRSCGKPPGQHDDDCINHAGQFGYEANRGGVGK